MLAASFVFPLLGAAQTPDSHAESYREQLRSASEDGQAAAHSSDEASREAYKQHLRRLAESGGLSPTVANSGTPTIALFESAATKESQDQMPGATAGTARETVSGKDSTGQSLPASASNSAGQACADSYCKELKQIAGGRDSAVGNAFVANERQNPTTEHNFVKNLALDQVHIWESPFKLRDSDATWAIPFGIVTGSLIDTDRDLSKQLAKPSRQSVSKQISDAGLFGGIGVGAGF